MPEYLRAYYERADTPSQAGDTMRFVASTEGMARDGMVISADAWQLDNFRKNPVFLFSHDYFSRPPIGKVTHIAAEDKRLVADVVFDQDDEFARSIEHKYRNGFLSAVSVGWDTLKVEPARGAETAPRITKADLLDISAVMVPADPDALKERQKRGLAAVVADLTRIIESDDPPEHRSAMAPHSTDKADEGASWDGPGEVAKASSAAQLRRMHAWMDSDGDPDTKQSYKLPHHLAESGQVVWRGVAAAMGRLLQAGTQIPDSDRRGVYNHLSRHYAQFDRTPPEFRSNAELDALSIAEIRGLFLEGEPELFPDVFVDQRSGAVLSKRNADDLAQAISLIQGVLARAGTKEDQEQEEERAARLLHAIITGATS